MFVFDRRGVRHFRRARHVLSEDFASGKAVFMIRSCRGLLAIYAPTTDFALVDGSLCAMSQLSLFGAETPPTDGLFLAVLPQAQVRPRIEGTAQQLHSRHGLKGKLLPPHRYHVSLFS